MASCNLRRKQQPIARAQAAAQAEKEAASQAKAQEAAAQAKAQEEAAQAETEAAAQAETEAAAKAKSQSSSNSTRITRILFDLPKDLRRQRFYWLKWPATTCGAHILHAGFGGKP